VRHPVAIAFGAAHFVRSKKNKYGLSLTSASRPHLRPCESVGDNSVLGSPCVNAETNVLFIRFRILLNTLTYFSTVYTFIYK